ncbi:MAG TPA: PadR family transcriptional regulator [Candidatus Saccharimonadales bacterium]
MPLPRFNFESAAEDLLVDNGLVGRGSRHRRVCIECIGCRWLTKEQNGEEPIVWGYEILKCTNMETGTLYPMLGKLAEAGVIAAEHEEYGRRPRTVYRPVDTELGMEFKDRLYIPKQCPLEI